jgi:hypothetical protein
MNLKVIDVFRSITFPANPLTTLNLKLSGAMTWARILEIFMPSSNGIIDVTGCSRDLWDAKMLLDVLEISGMPRCCWMF